MNLYSNKIKKKYFPRVAICIILIALLSNIIPALRVPAFNILKHPLSVITLIEREIRGIIFYHRNMVNNERLIKEADLLKQKLNAAQEAYLENQRLKNLLSFKQSAPYRLLAARVIGRSSDNWSSVVSIDKGRHSGIKRGFVAITHLGLVGRIVDTQDYTSRIMLINDPNCSVSALVQQSRQDGLICGTSGESLIMKYLPKDSDIKASDTIITSGLTGRYPKGLLIGTVVNIGEEFSGLSRYAIVKPAVKLSSLEEVLIIMP